MWGAIAGDIIGSAYERHPIKTRRFRLFRDVSRFTDDTVLTVAVADRLLHGGDYTRLFQTYFHRYPDAGFGGTFSWWASARETRPYQSWGNGSAMRVSPVGWSFDTLDEVVAEAKRCAEVTHNHPEGIRGAAAVATAVYLARTGHGKRAIRQQIEERFGYDLSETVAEIRPAYAFDVSCQGSVPQSIICFLESDDYEDTVRTAVSLGGDSDTMACIAGAIAEAHYGPVPDAIRDKARERLDDDLLRVTDAFCTRYVDPARRG